MSKPAKNYQEQLDLLKSRGLAVADESFALHCLANYNFYPTIHGECALDSELAITFYGFRKPKTVFPQIIGPSAVRALDHSRVAEPEGLFLYRYGYCNLDRW